jgi:hypothetical protein
MGTRGEQHEEAVGEFLRYLGLGKCALSALVREGVLSSYRKNGEDDEDDN